MRVEPRHIEVVDDCMVEILRRKSGAERLRIAFGLFSSARRMLLSHLRAEHPDWSDEQVNAEAVRRLSHGAIGTAPPSGKDGRPGDMAAN
jgi:hypothetical protein